MRNNSELKLLPSKVILPDGSIVELDSMAEKEKLRIRSSMCRNISNQISNYYCSRDREWENFISVMME